MARLSKCKGCGVELQPKDRKVFSNKTYCDSCYNLKLKEKTEYDALINWVCEYWKQDSPNGLILKQIKDYKDTFNYTYAGMHYCLWYVTSILGQQLELKYGVAKVKYYYDKSKEYYLDSIKRETTAMHIDETYNNVITRKPSSGKSYNKNWLFNIDNMV